MLCASRLTLVLAFSCAIVPLMGCDAPHPLAATVHSRSHAAHFDLDTLGGFSIPTPANNDNNSGALGSTFTGIVVPPNVMHFVYVGGTIQVAANADFTCCFPTLPTPAAGSSVGPMGWVDAQGDSPQFYIYLAEADWPSTLYPLTQNGSSPAVSDTQYFSGPDSIYVSRTGFSNAASCNGYGNDSACTCPSGPCSQWSAGAYTFSGTQYLNVLLAPQPVLTITSDQDTVSAGTNVNFTRTLTPATFGSQSWQMGNDRQWSFAGNTNCYGGTTCGMTVNQSGWGKFVATINGTFTAESTYVVVQ